MTEQEREIRHTKEGGGHVATCRCGWLVWTETKAETTRRAEKHKCRQTKE